MEKDIEEKTVNEYSPIEHPYSQRIDEANEYREHNKALDQSPEFQKIEQEVDNEVYRQFALERIQQAKKYLAEHGDYEDTFDDEFDAPTEYDIYLSKGQIGLRKLRDYWKCTPMSQNTQHVCLFNLVVVIGYGR